MHEHKIKGKWKHDVPTPKRQGDAAIMDSFIEDTNIREEQLVAANRCRLYMRITLMSGMTTGLGNRIIPGFLDGSSRGEVATQEYPEQGMPTKKDWSIWKELVEYKFLYNNLPDTSLKPHRCLGGWINGNGDSWEWFHSEEHDQVYQRMDTYIKVYQPTRHRSRSYKEEGTQEVLPPDAQRTVIQIQEEGIVTHTSTSIEIHNTTV